ncbi:MAG: dihydrofolate reductase [Blastocatellia bacterium]|nr:dihydrofolate reductase [Blastocatellia bacterium]
MIIGIVAISKNFAIGKDGKLPWHYPADLKFFKQTTTGKTIVMGWNTWKSIGKPLPNRLNIVLSSRGEIDERSDVKLARRKDDVLRLAHDLGGDVFIIGGSKTYLTFADQIDKWYVTEVPLTVEDADTFMPRDFLDGFEDSDEVDLGEALLVRTYNRETDSR